MPEKTRFRPGEPTWVDLGSPDLAASRAFYSALFGWEAEEGPPDVGGYTNFTLGGKNVAGLGPLMGEGQPPAWSVYVGVVDAEATVVRVEAADGQILVEPMDVMEFGKMAVLADPTGAVFSIWQAGTHKGFDVVGEPGSYAWAELASRDEAKAREFYEAVFGWSARVAPGYTEFQLDGDSVAGLMAVPDMVPAEVPGYWMPYFAAPDPDATAARAAELGGTVLMPGTDFGDGRFAVVQDPHGAVFGLLRLGSSQQSS